MNGFDIIILKNRTDSGFKLKDCTRSSSYLDRRSPSSSSFSSSTYLLILGKRPNNNCFPSVSLKKKKDHYQQTRRTMIDGWFINYPNRYINIYVRACACVCAFLRLTYT